MAYGYQGIGIYPMGPGGPMIPIPGLGKNDDDDRTVRRTPQQPEVRETWTPDPAEQHRQELEARLLRAMRDPDFHERLTGLSQESDNQWQRVGNPETWKQAGVTPEDMLGINERSQAEMERRVAAGMDKGEAAYLAQAGELSRWAYEHLEGAPADQLGALQEMYLGGQAYVLAREEFIRLRTESGLAELSEL